MADQNDRPGEASSPTAPTMSDEEIIDRARRRLLAKAIYVPPAVIGALALSLEGCQVASCNPTFCQPSGCNPVTCNPNNCNPVTCSPGVCSPSTCNPGPGCNPSLCGPQVCNPNGP